MDVDKTAYCCLLACLYVPARVSACSAMRRVLDMPALVLHGDSDVALGEELLDGIEAAVPDVSTWPPLMGRLGVMCLHFSLHCDVGTACNMRNVQEQTPYADAL